MKNNSRKNTCPHNPLLPDETRFLHSEGIDYSQTSADSIWGTEEPETVAAISKYVAGGHWLNLCAGDGRFNRRLLEKADRVTAFDLDEGALWKLGENAPPEMRDKLDLRIGNVVESLPFGEGIFGGVFCTGTLHLFPEQILENIASEMKRILRPSGMVILDYATDIERLCPDGSRYFVPGEPNVSLQEGIAVISRCFAGWKRQLSTGISPPEEVVTPARRYVFSCQFIVLVANP